MTLFKEFGFVMGVILIDIATNATSYRAVGAFLLFCNHVDNIIALKKLALLFGSDRKKRWVQLAVRFAAISLSLGLLAGNLTWSDELVNFALLAAAAVTVFLFPAIEKYSFFFTLMTIYRFSSLSAAHISGLKAPARRDSQLEFWIFVFRTVLRLILVDLIRAINVFFKTRQNPLREVVFSILILEIGFYLSLWFTDHNSKLLRPKLRVLWLVLLSSQKSIVQLAYNLQSPASKQTVKLEQ